MLGTVAVHGVGFVKKVRATRITLVRMTRASREAIVGDLLRRLQDAGVTQRGGEGDPEQGADRAQSAARPRPLDPRRAGTREPGVACAGAGAGKSAFLVAVALDHLLAGRQVLHVALDHPVDRVRDYYDEIFSELAATKRWRTCRARQEIERNRRIHVFAPTPSPWSAWSRRFSSSSSTPGSIRMSRRGRLRLRAWIHGGGGAAEILAAARGAELWMSARLRKDGSAEPIAAYDGLIDVLLRLKETAARSTSSS